MVSTRFYDSFCIQIYSVVERVAHVVLIANGANVNEFLVREGHARICEENYMSKVIGVCHYRVVVIN